MDFYPVGRKDIAGSRAPHGEAFAFARHVDEEIGRRLQLLPVDLNGVKELDVVLRSTPACVFLPYERTFSWPSSLVKSLQMSWFISATDLETIKNNKLSRFY
jgi:hypothetical protein